MLIAHPPCTYITAASAVELSKHPERLQKGIDGAEFLLSFLSADCERICVENPPPMRRFGLPTPTGCRCRNRRRRNKMEELNGYAPPVSLNLNDFQYTIGDAVAKAIAKAGIQVDQEKNF